MGYPKNPVRFRSTRPKFLPCFSAKGWHGICGVLSSILAFTVHGNFEVIEFWRHCCIVHNQERKMIPENNLEEHLLALKSNDLGYQHFVDVFVGSSVYVLSGTEVTTSHLKNV